MLLFRHATFVTLDQTFSGSEWTTLGLQLPDVDSEYMRIHLPFILLCVSYRILVKLQVRSCYLQIKKLNDLDHLAVRVVPFVFFPPDERHLWAYCATETHTNLFVKGLMQILLSPISVFQRGPA